MSVRNLQFLFEPKSVAVIGASARPQSVGATVLANMLGGGFKGALYAVNPKYTELAGLPSTPTWRRCRRRRTWPSSARRRIPCRTWLPSWARAAPAPPSC